MGLGLLVQLVQEVGAGQRLVLRGLVGGRGLLVEQRVEDVLGPDLAVPEDEDEGRVPPVGGHGGLVPHDQLLDEVVLVPLALRPL